MNLNDLLDIAAEINEERERGYDLWTWLPSHRSMERVHRHHGGIPTPNLVSILAEAAAALSYLRHGTLEDWDLFQCPCQDEECIKTREDIAGLMQEWRVYITEFTDGAP